VREHSAVVALLKREMTKRGMSVLVISEEDEAEEIRG
jgi:hypothetical protein